MEVTPTESGFMQQIENLRLMIIRGRIMLIVFSRILFFVIYGFVLYSQSAASVFQLCSFWL